MPPLLPSSRTHKNHLCLLEVKLRSAVRVSENEPSRRFGAVPKTVVHDTHSQNPHSAQSLAYCWRWGYRRLAYVLSRVKCSLLNYLLLGNVCRRQTRQKTGGHEDSKRQHPDSRPASPTSGPHTARWFACYPTDHAVGRIRYLGSVCKPDGTYEVCLRGRANKEVRSNGW